MILSQLLLPVLLQSAPTAPVLPQTPRGEPNHHLVLVRVKDASTLERVLSLDLDIAACTALELPVQDLEVIADDGDIAKLRRAGIPFRVAVRNLEDDIEKRLQSYVFPQKLTPPVGQGAMGGHYTLAQTIAILDKFQQTNPKICAKKISLGKSIEKRDIWVVKISDNVHLDENEPEVLFDAVHHAREPLSVTTTLLFMDWLIDNYGKNAEATHLVDNRELYFVPVLNPDGYEYNRSIRPSGGGMWRKNRRNNGGGVFGVDLNRNYPTGWNAPFGGNSTNPRSQVYRGTKPFSEPEALAIDNFIKSRKFTIGCSTHTYSEILLRPWAYQRGDPPNVARYRIVDAAATKANPIRVGAASQILYIAAGTALDHYHQGHGMLGYTPELGKGSEGGFWPNPTNQVRIANRHQPMFRALARYAGAVLSPGHATVKEGPGSNRNGRVEPGETGEILLPIVNDGAGPTVTNAVVTLGSLTRGVTITANRHDYGKIQGFSSARNASSSLMFKLDSTFRGVIARIEVAIAYEGLTVKQPIDLELVTVASVIGDDFEKNLGFARSTFDTARTGRFERTAPQQTTYLGRVYQPGSDHTPGPGRLCWVTDGRAGRSVGSFDVDSGKTTLLSPPMDLRHVAAAELVVWTYYSESVSPGDPFTIDVSTDGGSTWKNLYTRTTSTNGWTRLRLKLSGISMTDRMQFRFNAQDLVSQSLVEALVDDLEIRGIVQVADLTILGSAARGTVVRFAMHGEPNGFAITNLALGTANIAFPGIEGRFLLDPQTLAVLPPLPYAASDRVTLDLLVPNDASLVATRIYWQQLFYDGKTKLKLGNRTSIQIR